MKKRDIVKSNDLFNEIINKGKKVTNEYFTIFYYYNENNKPLFGITASKKNGNAVIRNRLKRQTRHLVDEAKLLFKKDKNYIIIVKKKCLEDKFEKKLNSLKHLIGEIQ